MTTWWWVRHGPTHRKEMVGWTDAPADLSDSAHLDWLRQTLPDNAPIVSSDLSRAIETADVIQGSRTRLGHSHALREIHFGDWEGKHFDDINQTSDSHIRRFWEEPGDIKAPNGEGWHDLAARVSDFVDAQPQVADIIAVAHMGTILTQVQRALSLSNYDTLSHRIDNLSVTKLCYAQGRWSAKSINQLP